MAEQTLLTTIEQCEQGYYFPALIFHLDNQIDRLRKIASHNAIKNIDAILKPMVDFREMLHSVEQKMQSLFFSICNQAKPGVIVESYIISQIRFLRTEPVFKKMIKLGADIIAKYINNKENIKKIHDLVIDVRVKECKEKLSQDVNGFYLLKAEIKKITHYRVRRNVLSCLFDSLMYEDSLFNNDLKKKEQCLLILQQEYLYAVYRQVENMVLDKAISFLSEVKHERILKPVPKKKWFYSKNNHIFHELNYLLNHISEHVLKSEIRLEPAALYHIDSPIEQDIIGEITRRLSNAIQHNAPGWQSFNAINEIMEHTHKLLIAPDFNAENTLESWILIKAQHDKVFKLLMEEKNIIFRLDRICMLYDLVKDKEKFKTSMKNSILKTQKAAVCLLQECYLQTLPFLWVALKKESDAESRFWFRCFLQEASNLALFNSPIAPKESKKASIKLNAELNRYHLI